MLVAVQIDFNTSPLDIKVYHWTKGGCATLDSDGWAGWSTPNQSSHPSQSETEFLHNCAHTPGNFYIKANDDEVIITNLETNDEWIL